MSPQLHTLLWGTGNAVGNLAIVWWCSTMGGVLGLVGVVSWGAIAIIEVRRDLYTNWPSR